MHCDTIRWVTEGYILAQMIVPGQCMEMIVTSFQGQISIRFYIGISIKYKMSHVKGRYIRIIITASEVVLAWNIDLLRDASTGKRCRALFCQQKIILYACKGYPKHRSQKLNPSMMMYLLVKQWLISWKKFITILCELVIYMQKASPVHVNFNKPRSAFY